MKLLLALLLSASPFVAEASAPLREVPVTQIRPTQAAVGRAACASIREERLEGFKTVPELQAFLSSDKKGLPAVLGPGGIIFIVDGHHRSVAVHDQAKKLCQGATFAACMDGVKIVLRITEDLSHLSWKDFAEFMWKNNNVYLPAPLRRQVEQGKVAKADIFTGPKPLLPRDFDKLGDDPYRSAIGKIFHEDKISGENFENYLEFHLGEKLGGKVPVTPGQEFDPAVAAKLRKAIYGDPEIRRFFRCLARTKSKDWKQAQDSIDAASGVKEPEITPELCKVL